MSSQSNRFIATVVVAMLGLAAPAWAQKADKIPARNFAELSRRALLRSGDSVEVATFEATRKGRFVGLTDDKMLVEIKGVKVVLEESSVRRVDRRGDPVWNGALYTGLGLGAFFALLEAGCEGLFCFGPATMGGRASCSAAASD